MPAPWEVAPLPATPREEAVRAALAQPNPPAEAPQPLPADTSAAAPEQEPPTDSLPPSEASAPWEVPPLTDQQAGQLDARVGSTIGSGLSRGILQTIAFPLNAMNSLSNMFDTAFNKVNTFLGIKTPRLRLDTDLANSTFIPALDKLNKKVGAASAFAGQGTMLGNVSEFAGASLAAAPLGAGPAPLKLASLAKEGLTGVTAGTGSEMARKAFPGSSLAPVLGAFAGGVSGGAGLAGATRRAVRGDYVAINKNLETLSKAGITNPTLAIATQRLSNAVVESGAAIIPGGISIMRGAAERLSQQAKASLDRISGGMSDSFRAGRAVESGLFEDGGFVQRFRNKSSALYGEIDQQIAPGTRVDIPATRALYFKVQQLAQQEPELAKVLTNPKMAEISRLLTMAAPPAGMRGSTILGLNGTPLQVFAPSGTIEYGLFKQVRSAIGEMLGQPELLTGIPKAQLKSLYAAVSDDMLGAAQHIGPDAVRSVSRANTYYKAGISRMENIIDKVANKATPDEAFNWIISGNLRDSTKLQTIKKSLGPNSDEWALMRNTVLAKLGREKGDSPFSSSVFMDRYANLEPRSRDLLFGGTPNYEKNMNELLEAFRLINGGPQALKHISGTAPTLMSSGTIAAAIGGIISGNVQLLAVLGQTAAGVNISARLLTSPKFVEWAARATHIPFDRLPAEVVRLNKAMQDDPQYDDALTEFNIRMSEVVASAGKNIQAEQLKRKIAMMQRTNKDLR